MTDNFKEIGSLFGREGSGAGFVKQTDKESFTYAFAWPEGDTWLRDMDAFVFVSGRKIEALEDLSGLLLAGNCSGLDIDRILQRPKCLG